MSIDRSGEVVERGKGRSGGSIERFKKTGQRIREQND